MKTIGINDELDPVYTAVWLPKLLRKDYAVGLALGASAIDDPDPVFYTSYRCGADLNITRYRNPEIDQLIDRRLQQDGARPIIFFYSAATCWQPYVRASRSWSTASTTVGAWRMSGSIDDPTASRRSSAADSGKTHFAVQNGSQNR